MTTYQVICLLTRFSCTCIYTLVSEIDIIDNGIKAINAMELLKPVYMRNGDLQSDRNNIITDYELSIAVSNTIMPSSATVDQVSRAHGLILGSGKSGLNQV